MDKKYLESSIRMLEFIEKSPTCFHVVENLAEHFESAGFSELREEETWKIEAGGRYFVRRNGSSIIAFSVPSEDFENFQIMATHGDSPAFKIKENPELSVADHYVLLNVEKYGGMLCAPWFDRPLSVAGRITVRTENGFDVRLVNVDRDLLLIPSLAIHLDRNANSGHEYNVQNEMLPVFGCQAANGEFWQIIAEYAGVKKEDILASDLFLYNSMKGSIWGAFAEYVSSARLDDLQCVFATCEGFVRACMDSGNKNSKSVAMTCVFDNEEVGSSTKQGADSTFLADVMERICMACKKNPAEEFKKAVASSFMISSDNAHAFHPNFSYKYDPVNRPHINRGIVIKFNGNQKYTSDAVSAAVVKELCRRCNVPFQVYTNRSDIPGGSTLGNISSSHVSLDSVDIGLAQLAMHSPYETAGIKDTQFLIEFSREFFETHIAKFAGTKTEGGTKNGTFCRYIF